MTVGTHRQVLASSSVQAAGQRRPRPVSGRRTCFAPPDLDGPTQYATAGHEADPPRNTYKAREQNANDLSSNQRWQPVTKRRRGASPPWSSLKFARRQGHALILLFTAAGRRPLVPGMITVERHAGWYTKPSDLQATLHKGYYRAEIMETEPGRPRLVARAHRSRQPRLATPPPVPLLSGVHRVDRRELQIHRRGGGPAKKNPPP
jgi:hypothetical protein